MQRNKVIIGPLQPPYVLVDPVPRRILNSVDGPVAETQLSQCLP